MLMAITLLTLFIKIPYGITIFRKSLYIQWSLLMWWLIFFIFNFIYDVEGYSSFVSGGSCVPNTQFLLNGKLCNCNSLGQSSDASCQTIGRRQSCQPGQIIWEECSQCICQENGKLLCTNTECEEPSKPRTATRSASAVWCTPFRSYYVNCTLCVCPASGKMSEARCATDSSCSLKGIHTSLDTIPQNICIPKVMYLFACLHCLCSDDGLFLKSKCIETCHKPAESPKRCIPKSFYKSECNICRCPENGIPDSNLCSKSTCNQSQMTSLNALRNESSLCSPNKYTKPRCIFCECNSQGTVNEQACLEQECIKLEDFNYDSVKTTCSQGELVPTCVECFCPRGRYTIEKYCTSVCSSQNKIAILENVLKEKNHLIDRNMVKETAGTDTCDPNSLFLDQGRYCLCSDSGNTNFKHCTSVLEDTGPKKPSQVFIEKDTWGPRKIDFNISCEPNTYLEFGCNSCYCTKYGKIDPKWCTSDDCEAKKLIHDSINKARTGTAKALKDPGTTTTCTPGSVSKKGCNFCICGSSGLLSERTCTKNPCDGQYPITSEDLTCDPSSYYTVDCNMCYCPSDGIKNVDRCTKNQCETNFLRSDSCVAGQLFSSECNICICPPNGDKKDRVCTNRTCFENETSWNKIFKISQHVLGYHAVDDVTKNLEPCFPGDEFESGCKVCVCPDTGMKEHASCTSNMCDLHSTLPDGIIELEEEIYERSHSNHGYDMAFSARRLHTSAESHEHELDNTFCNTYQLNDSIEIKECTPGSEYIIRCKICICPYMGVIGRFCRPMPEDRFCEQAYPGFNFASMGRRTDGVNTTTANNTETSIKNNYSITFDYPHNHTRYKCDVDGLMQENCFICDCKKNVFIEEHCYKSDTKNCTNVLRPSFIKLDNKLLN